MSTKSTQKISTISHGKRFLLIGSFLLAAVSCHAQYFSDSLYYQNPKSPPKAILKMDLLSGFRTFSAISLSLEHKLRSDLYLEHQVDVLTNINNVRIGISPITDKYSGIQLHSELKYYLDFRHFSQKGIYIAPKIMFGHVTRKRENTLRLDCGSGCEYFKRVNYDARENIAGLHFKFGVQRIYRESIVIDYYLGVGYATHAFKIKGLSELEKKVVIAREQNRGLRSSAVKNYTAATLTVGFKIGIILK